MSCSNIGIITCNSRFDLLHIVSNIAQRIYFLYKIIIYNEYGDRYFYYTLFVIRNNTLEVREAILIAIHGQYICMIVQHLLKRLMDNIFHNIIPIMIPLPRSIKNILETELIVPQISFTESKCHLLLPMLPKIEKFGPLYAIKT